MKRRTWFLAVMGVVAVLGIVNAAYLSLMALSGVAPNCNFIQGCDLVAASPYSKIFDIPLAIFGVFFYTVALGMVVWNFFERSRTSLILLFGVATLGFLLSLYFLYLQAFVIQAYCEYCLFSLFDATVLFILSGILWVFDMRKTGSVTQDAESTALVYNNDI